VGEREGVEGKGGGGGKGGQMTQTLYAHMNKRNFKKSNFCEKNDTITCLKVSEITFSEEE
jgi:hypothetical protein